ncbi:hypothetical protein E1B28_002733 [Marasmius oreades]|uniref:Uncharacterized protein n=1 Tax=Marasmius oreades TaxID=181124 RepID=A0A9P7UL50_9AGAR|nr:uncharacterized protein E1B28_002733 [Marasmius oreades]KAG7086807.1 hypothetical protein E1B28_002733 [Marasmius oreades]
MADTNPPPLSDLQQKAPPEGPSRNELKKRTKAVEKENKAAERARQAELAVKQAKNEVILQKHSTALYLSISPNRVLASLEFKLPHDHLEMERLFYSGLVFIQSVCATRCPWSSGREQNRCRLW